MVLVFFSKKNSLMQFGKFQLTNVDFFKQSYFDISIFFRKIRKNGIRATVFNTFLTPEDESVRVDLRHLDICSVDPPRCTDIDDALHCKHLDNGNFEVGVHIADVSHFIRPGTAIDQEAANRGTTVYLTDRRIDMVFYFYLFISLY
jgi:hypothetical protein